MEPRSFGADEFERFMEGQLYGSQRNEMRAQSLGSDNDVGAKSQEQLLDTINKLVEQNAQMLRMMQLNQTAVRNDPQKDNFHVMPDLSKQIDDFDGEKGPGVAETWIKQIETTSNLHNWPEAFTIQTAKMHLVGAAKFWYRGRADTIRDWISFKIAFKKTFMFERSATDLWKKMQTRVQQPKENIALYFHEKVALCKDLNLSFKELKEQIIIGLMSRELSNFLFSKDQEDEDELFQDIIEYERICSARKLKAKDQRFDRGFDQKDNFIRTDKSSNSRQELQVKKETPRSSVPLKCFNCNMEGHRFYDCPKPKRPKGSCYSCGSIEHMKKDCPRNAALWIEELKPPFMIPLQFEIGSKEVVVEKACLDTGSPINLIKAGILPPNPYILENDKQFYGINRVQLNVYGVFENQVIVQDFLIPLKFYVVPDNTMSFPILLGRDFMNSKDFKVVIDTDEVKIFKISSSSVEKEINQIMLIDTVENSEPCINVNPEIDFKSQSDVRDIIYDYLNAVKPAEPMVNFECKITVNQERPFSFRPRKLSFEEKNALQIILDELLEKNIIRESYSSYCSPIVLLKKKNGKEYRLCCDYRELNKLILRDHFPLPLIEDQIDLLKNKKYFTCLDLKSGFHHIKLTEDSIKYTSFICSLGQYEYLRLPFGISNGPSVFCRYINLIFKDLIKEKKLLTFSDDLMIATKTIEENVSILRKVLNLMNDNLLELNLDKCCFLKTKVVYLGYLVSSEGISPNPENVQAVQEYPVPDSVKKIQRFLGLASYFRKFIPSFAEIAKPLYDLVRKNSNFKFEENELNAFNTIKNKLITAPILSVYSPLLETQLHCDASSKGFGAILLQKQEDNLFRPVIYFSKRTSDFESKLHRT